MTLASKKNLLMNEELGWSNHKYEGGHLWFKGYLLNTNIQSLFSKIELIFKKVNFTSKDFSDLLVELKGHFAIVINCNGVILASVDRVSSIPLFYLDTPKDKTLSNNALYLSDYANLDTRLIDSSSVLQIAMSGYTIGNKTLFHGLKQLIAGQAIVIRDETIEQFSYYRYTPNITINSSKKILKDELTKSLEESFEELIKTIDGRQVVIPLSAGSDSRLIASGFKHLGYKNVLCFAYGNKNNFESKTSKYVANKLGYSWKHVPISRNSQRSFFHSEEFKDFCIKTETLASIPFIQDVSAVRWLKNNGIISKNAIIVNGNTGDFISGGHIPRSLKKESIENIDLRTLTSNSWDDFINKHFSLWGVLRSKENDDNIIKSLKNSLSGMNIAIPSDKEILHGIFESLEYFGRQSKFIVNMQRSYEFYDYSWRMPLWSNQMLDFWEKVPRKYKIEQNLYKEVLNENNWGGVWDKIPINSGEINSRSLRSARLFFKLMYFPFGVNAWHSFERNVFQYFLDNTQNSSIVPYYKVLLDRRGQRHSVSWLAEMYLNKKGFENISKNFPNK
jgi:asparagine synthase (glutamine-hydrolysing)